jgi:hypothetical protein
MNVKNEFDLPDAFVGAVSRDYHSKDGEYSATTLLKGTCEIILTKRHWEEISVDASDCVWQVFGTATHKIFERQKDDSFKEEFFSVDVLNSKVTGRVDNYDMERGILTDWKTSSVWKVQLKDFSDWRKQGLIYAWLMRKSGLEVKVCRFVALLKDHSKSKARFDSSYPQKPLYVYEFPVTDKDLEEIEGFIFGKVKGLEEAEKIPDGKLPPCGETERWASPEKWAVMKKGRKSALRVCDSEPEAEEYKAAKGGDYIEHRKGESKKCIDGYCICRNFCPFYKSLKLD